MPVFPYPSRDRGHVGVPAPPPHPEAGTPPQGAPHSPRPGLSVRDHRGKRYFRRSNDYFRFLGAAALEDRGYVPLYPLRLVVPP